MCLVQVFEADSGELLTAFLRTMGSYGLLVWRGEKGWEFHEPNSSTPQGEARRKQIEKVVVDGDNAALNARDGPKSGIEVRLAKTKDGWKIAK